MKRVKLTIEPYDLTLYVVCAKNFTKARREFDKDFGREKGDLKLGGAWVIKLGRSTWLTLFKPRPSFRTVLHECFHVAHRMSDYCSLHFDDTHHEATAFLLEHIALQVLGVTHPDLPLKK